MSTILLSKNDIRELLDIEEVIKVVEEVFNLLEQGKSSRHHKAYLLVIPVPCM